MTLQKPNQGYDDEGSSDSPLIGSPGGDNPTNSDASEPGGNLSFANRQNINRALNNYYSKGRAGLDSQESNPNSDSTTDSAVDDDEQKLSDKSVANTGGDTNESSGLFGEESPSKVKKVLGPLGRLRRRSAVTIAILSLMGGGGIGAIIIGQGPMQLMQYSRILQRMTSDQDDANETRMNGLFRYARTGNIGETRVTFLGSRSAAKTTEKLKNMGITYENRTANGRVSSIKIDVSKYDPGANTAKTAEAISKEMGISKEYIRVERTLGTKNGNIFIEAPTRGDPLPFDVANRTDKAVVGKLFEGRRFGSALTAIKARPVINFNASYGKLHPIKKINSNLMEKAVKADEERRAKRLERTGKAKARIGDLKDKINPSSRGVVRVAGGLAVVQMGVCIAKEIAQETPLVTYENVVGPSRDLAVERVSAGDQLRSFEDLGIAQFGSNNSSLQDKTGSVWQGQALNAVATGTSGSGVPMPDDVKSAYSTRSTESDVDSMLNSVGGEAICSTPGLILGGAVGIAALVLAPGTGGASTTAVYAAKAVAGSAVAMAGVAAVTTLMPKLLADKPLLADMPKPFEGNVTTYGMRSFGNDLAAKSGGIALEGPQAAEAEKESNLAYQKEFQSRSFLARTFDPTDARSLSGKAIDSVNVSSPQTIASSFSNLMNISSIPSKLLSTFTPKVSAADNGTYDFGFPIFGFAKKDLTNPLMADPYDNAEKAAQILSENSSYIGKAEQCFGVKLSQGNHGWQVNVIENPDADPQKEVLPNTGKYISAKCAEGGDDWLRVRLFIFDSRTMDAYACYDADDANPDDADEMAVCNELGIGNGDSTAQTGGSTSNSGGSASLPSGTRDELVNKILASDKWKPQSANPTNDLKNGIAKDPLVKQIAAIVEQQDVAIHPSVIKTGHDDCSSSGNTSNHYNGLAVDLGNAGVPLGDMQKLYKWLFDNREALDIDELIFSPVPSGTYTLKAGKKLTYDAETLAGHTSHIHVSANGPKEKAPGCR